MKQGSTQETANTPQALVDALVKKHGELTPWQIKELKRTIAGIIAGI